MVSFNKKCDLHLSSLQHSVTVKDKFMPSLSSIPNAYRNKHTYSLTHTHTSTHPTRSIRELGPEGTFPDSPSFYPGMVFAIPNSNPAPPPEYNEPSARHHHPSQQQPTPPWGGPETMGQQGRCVFVYVCVHMCVYVCSVWCTCVYVNVCAHVPQSLSIVTPEITSVSYPNICKPFTAIA